MTALRDTGFAKINLTLDVLGRRADGFHEIESLVAFAALGDHVELEPGDRLDLTVEGPFAGALSGDNLVLQAAETAKALKSTLRLGRFRAPIKAPCLRVTLPRWHRSSGQTSRSVLAVNQP